MTVGGFLVVLKFHFPLTKIPLITGRMRYVSKRVYNDPHPLLVTVPLSTNLSFTQATLLLYHKEQDFF